MNWECFAINLIQIVWGRGALFYSSDSHQEMTLSLEIRRILSIILCNSLPYSFEVGSLLEPGACEVL